LSKRDTDNIISQESGIASPRLGVCALNPHNGESGSFGRQEIDAIAPAVEVARKSYNIDVQGPFPSDTVFLKRDHFDAIVTMYHDQGQIALKLLNFEGGVTVQGGLPIVIATPAHGTAFDIVGQNLASVVSTQNAFDIAVEMAMRRIAKEEDGSATFEAEPVSSNGQASNGVHSWNEKSDLTVGSADIRVPACC